MAKDNVTKVTIPGGLKPEVDNTVVKVDLNNPPKPVVEEEEIVGENVVDPVVDEEVIEPVIDGTLEEIIDEVVDTPTTTTTIDPVITKEIPTNVQKLVDFMEETGGDISDYVRLNTDTANLDNSEVLDMYYEKTKPHLSAEERDFLLEDRFGFDEELDEERVIRGKKIALKEQVAEARAYIDGQKSKYYEEIKAGSKLTGEQQDAISFFNRYNEESERSTKIASDTKAIFNKKTDDVFNDEFKGFDYNVGDKKFRFNVKNVDDVKTSQSDINNFIKKFLDKDNNMGDAKGYHKSLFAAMNSDALAQHFYEQGKADAVRDVIKKGKNINTDARGTHNSSVTGGTKYRSLGESSSDYKLKIKKRR